MPMKSQHFIKQRGSMRIYRLYRTYWIQ